jgi:hypothetical protein
VQPIPSSYSASNLTVGSTTARGQLSPFSLGQPLGEPRHQYRPQRPTRLNVPDNTYCLSCLPSGLNFSEAMTAKQLSAQSREEVSYSDPNFSFVLFLQYCKTHYLKNVIYNIQVMFLILRAIV